MSTLLCGHHPHHFQNFLAPSQTETLTPLDRNTPSPSPSPQCPPFHLLSLSATLLGSSWKRTHAILVFLWLAYFAQHNVLRVHQCCSVGRNSIPFYGRIIFHGTDRHLVLIHSSTGRHLGCVHVLTIVTNALVNLGVQISLHRPAFSFSACVPRSGFAGSYGDTMFNLLRNYLTVSQTLDFWHI